MYLYTHIYIYLYMSTYCDLCEHVVSIDVQIRHSFASKTSTTNTSRGQAARRASRWRWREELFASLLDFDPWEIWESVHKLWIDMSAMLNWISMGHGFTMDSQEASGLEVGKSLHLIVDHWKPGRRFQANPFCQATSNLGNAWGNGCGCAEYTCRTP